MQHLALHNKVHIPTGRTRSLTKAHFFRVFDSNIYVCPKKTQLQDFAKKLPQKVARIYAALEQAPQSTMVDFLSWSVRV